MLDLIFIIPVCLIFVTIIYVVLGRTSYSQFGGVFFYIITIIISLYICGFRGDYGTDYENYVPIFRGDDELKSMGPFFSAVIVFFQLLAGRTSLTVISIFLFVWFLYCVFIDLIAKRFFEYRFFVAIYLHNFLLMSNMLGSLRQGLAVAVTSLAIMTVVSKSEYKAAFLSVFASTIHFGGLATIPFIAGRFLKVRYLPLLILFSILIFIFISSQYDVLEYKLQFYTEADGYTSQGTSILGKIVFFPFLIYLCIKIRTFSSYTAAAIFLLSCFVPIIFRETPIVAERIGVYMEVYKLLILYDFLSKEDEGLIFKMFLFLLTLSTLYKQYQYLTSWHDYFNFGMF